MKNNALTFSDIYKTIRTQVDKIITKYEKQYNVEDAFFNLNDHEALEQAIHDTSKIIQRILVKEIATKTPFEEVRTIGINDLQEFLFMYRWTESNDSFYEVISDTFFDEGKSAHKPATPDLLRDLSIEIYDYCLYSGKFENKDPMAAIQEIYNLLVTNVCRTTLKGGV